MKTKIDPTQIIALFPTPIYSTNLSRQFTEEETQAFDSILTNLRDNQFNKTSKDNYLLDNNPALVDLRQFFELHMNNYLATIVKPRNKVSLRITQSWLNLSKKDEMHHEHAHPNSYISGVFYVGANDTDKIHFRCPPGIHHGSASTHLRLPTSEFNEFNSSTWWLPTPKYRLYIFPSSLGHFVDPVTGDEDRISFAFNTYPVGQVGEEDNLDGLKL